MTTSGPDRNRYTADRARRLALVRHMLQRAEEEAERADPLYAPALLLMHDAAELFLVLVAEACGASVKSGIEFLAYWDPIDAAVNPQTIGHKAAMKAVSMARGGLKHHGIIPAATEVRRLAASTRTFLEDATATVFGVAFEEATLADLIDFPPARTALKEAQAALTANDIPRAVARARVAFELSLRQDDDRRRRQANWRHPLHSAAARLPSAHSIGLEIASGQPGFGRLGRAWDELVRVVTTTENAVQLMAKGIDYAEYMQFVALTPHAIWGLNAGEPDLLSDSAQRPATMTEAHWVVEFAIRSTLTMLG